MKKPGISRIAALIMGLALAIPTSEATAEPWTKTKATLGLGTNAIKNPTPPKSADSDEGWKGNYVYYGQYHTDDKRDSTIPLEPVKYRVLRNGETRFTVNTPTLFLDCDNMLYRTPFDRSGNKTNVWNSCTTRNYLNGQKKDDDENKKVFWDRPEAFSQAEMAAILFSKMDKPTLTTSYTSNLVPTGLTSGDYIFLLDITDVESQDYGYGSNGSRQKKFKYDRPKKSAISPNKTEYATWEQNMVWNSWWLRSPVAGKNNEAGRVTESGDCVGQSIPKFDIGASPAFNVKLSSVVFTSLVSGDAGKDGAEYKLTLLDANLNITPNTVTPSENTVTVSYNVTGDHVGQATHVSVLVTDGEWTVNGWTGGEVKYYKQFAISDNKSLSFDLPADYEASWNTYILAENVASGEYAANTTDYASAPKPLTLKFITATATGYTGTYDGKDHGINVTVTSPDSGFTVNYGTTAGTYDLTDSPTITNVEDSPLTVYYKITANDYVMKTGSADVTISKADSAVTTAPKATSDLTYTGSAQPLVTSGSTDHGTMVYSLEKDKGYSAEIPMETNAGTYTVYYMVSGDANYNDVTSDDYKLTVSIARKPVTVKAADKSKTSGEGDPALTAIVKGLVDLEDHKLIKYTLTRTAGEAVGTYAITPTGEKLQGNYAVTFENGTLTINQKSGSNNGNSSNSGGNESGTGGNNSGSGSGNGSSNTGGKAEEQKSGDSSATDGSSNGSDSSNNGQKVTVGFEKAHKEVADVVEKKLTELLPGLPDDVEFFSDPENMEFKGTNGLTSYIEKIIEKLEGSIRELTAVMSSVSVKTAGVYFVKVKVTDEQSKELIGTRNLAYHIERYLEDEDKGEAQVKIADAGEEESDIPNGIFVDENGDVVSGDYGGGDIYLLAYMPQADTTYVQYMTAEADQKPLEETTGNSSSPTSDSTSPSGYSGPTSNKGPGGCDAGFGGLAGLMILPLLARRRKK